MCYGSINKFYGTFEEGKFKPNLEGPFIVANDGSKGAYKIQSPCEKMEFSPRTLLI